MPQPASKSVATDQGSVSAANRSGKNTKTLPAVPVFQMEKAPVQLAVSHSATYSPAGIGAVENEINNLEAEVAGAEAKATRRVSQAHGHVHTAHQAFYMRNANQTNWGYCVEEMLDPKAINLGWSTQYHMAPSRPDYYKQVGIYDVFVDLTSLAQAGPFGSHITQKLTAAANGVPQLTWKAADITHASSNPLSGLPPRVINYNGVVTAKHMKYYQRYHDFLNNPLTNWDERMQNVFEQYGRISTAFFTQSMDQNDRDAFVILAKQKPQERYEPLEYGGDDDSMGEEDSQQGYNDDNLSDGELVDSEEDYNSGNLSDSDTSSS